MKEGGVTVSVNIFIYKGIYEYILYFSYGLSDKLMHDGVLHQTCIYMSGTSELFLFIFL